jgi:hypothetical protein
VMAVGIFVFDRRSRISLIDSMIYVFRPGRRVRG